jgi:ABC-type antimicrobial peptide transport system permease subunit
LPKQGIFFNDQVFDAYIFSSNLITSAKKSIVLIDNYINETTLLQLSKRNPKVSCTIYTEKITDQLKLDMEKHNAQYPKIEIRVLKHLHDRFLILDNQSLYHLGASLKDLGKRWFAFSRMDGLIGDVMKRLP